MLNLDYRPVRSLDLHSFSEVLALDCYLWALTANVVHGTHTRMRSLNFLPFSRELALDCYLWALTANVVHGTHTGILVFDCERGSWSL